MLSAWREMLKGPGGSYDTARILYATGGLAMTIAPVVFQGVALAKGQDWDPAAFCAGYGGGLAGVLSLGGLGIATKDKGVASALNTTPPLPPMGGQP